MERRGDTEDFRFAPERLYGGYVLDKLFTTNVKADIVIGSVLVNYG